MAEKHKYTVNRSMQDGATAYDRGDTREMTEIDAAPLIATGALSKPGAKKAEPEPLVRHTFGAKPNEDEGYVPATTDSVQLRRAGSPPAKPRKG